MPRSRTFIGDSDEEFAWLGANTIIRQGDSVTFDSIDLETYVRYRGNCRERAVAVSLATDSIVNPKCISPANGYIGRVIDSAGAVSR